ncbi:hypothetical protein D4764_04G0008610 [Takifugu flavidus]|uniref:Reverse transcriptase domain-containing protein n=1 Tax=Takifugu flavidus TaxID=433684 RepID=A0A5C6N443_9TELE|nr:hypothetical protein D4764_04G0008610 [Takifugu flavidus]
MKCLEREVEVQHTGPGPGETQEEPGQEPTHRSQSLHQIDQATAKGDVDSRLQAISTIIVSYGSERFGRIEKGNTETTAYTMNRRSFKIDQLRKELRTLKKQFKRAADGDKQALKELYNILRKKKLKTLRRAEGIGGAGEREQGSEQPSLPNPNPFRFSKQLLGDRRSGRLECSREEVNRFLQNTMSDPLRGQDLGPNRALISPLRGQDLGPNRALISPAPPSAEFKLAELSLKEVEGVIKAARSASSPGPSGVPYLVYKRCPEILRHLWKALKVIWRRGRVAGQSSAEGWDPGVPGCLEHNGVVIQLIREAHESKGELAVLWLDLTNAYRSIPHKLVELALHLHHVPSKIKDLILDYYDTFRLRVTSGAYMDDLTVTTTSVPGCRWILQGLERLILWAKMSFKPTKSRSMVLKKGKVVDKFRFSISGTVIPSITEQPVKNLGKLFDSSLKDTAAIQKSTEQLGGWLTKVDKSGLPGRFKAWIYQHSIQIRGLLLGHKPGLDHPGWVTWARVYDVLKPETPYEPRIHH